MILCLFLPFLLVGNIRASEDEQYLGTDLKISYRVARGQCGGQFSKSAAVLDTFADGIYSYGAEEAVPDYATLANDPKEAVNIRKILSAFHSTSDRINRWQLLDSFLVS